MGPLSGFLTLLICTWMSPKVAVPDFPFLSFFFLQFLNKIDFVLFVLLLSISSEILFPYFALVSSSYRYLKW